MSTKKIETVCMSEIDVNVISLFVTSPPTAFLTGREDIAFPGRDVGGH